MKRFQLDRDFCSFEIYGVSLADALLHCGPLPMQSCFLDGHCVPGGRYEVSEVLGTIPGGCVVCDASGVRRVVKGELVGVVDVLTDADLRRQPS